MSLRRFIISFLAIVSLSSSAFSYPMILIDGKQTISDWAVTNIGDSAYIRLDGTTTPTADIGWGGFAITDIDDIVGDASGSITNFLNIWAATDFYEGGVAIDTKYLGVAATAADSDKLGGVVAASWALDANTLKGAIADYQWTTGNVWYVAAGSDIEAAVTAAAAGDTLILASGTYTVTDDIDVTKALRIKGPYTTIACVTDSKNIFHVTVSNVQIEGISFDITASNTKGIFVDGTAGTILSGVIIRNCTFACNSHAGSQMGIRVQDANVDIYGVKGTAVSSDSTAYGIYGLSATTTEADFNVNIYNSDCTVTPTTAGSAFQTGAGMASFDVKMNLYYCRATSSDTAIYAPVEHAEVYAEGCILNGTTADAKQENSGVVQLKGCVLVNETTSGAITYGGALASTVQLDDDLSLKINATADGMADDKYNGITVTGKQAGEAITLWDCVQLQSDGKFDQADASTGGTLFPAWGLACNATGDGTNLVVLTRGVVRNEGWTGLTVGGAVYLSETAGEVTQVAPSDSGDCVQIVGFALSDSEILFDFSRPYLTVE